MSIPTFQSGQASIRRWILDDLERAVLAIQVTNGAAFSWAVSLDGDQVRTPNVEGTGGAQSTIDRSQAQQRGFAIAHLAFDDDVALSEVSGRQTVDTQVAINVELPAEDEWSGRRAEDVADALDRDLVLAVMHDRSRNNLAIDTRHAGGGALVFELDTGILVMERRFTVQHRHVSNDTQMLAPAGEPAPPAPSAALAVYHDGTAPGGESAVGDVAEAYASVGDGRLNLRVVGSFDTEDSWALELHEFTVQTLAAAIGAITGWVATDLSADLGVLAAPADDINDASETDVLLEPNKLALEIKA